MTAPELAGDGTVIARTLLSPSLGLAEAAARRRSLAALALSTAAAVAFAAASVPRVDHARAALARLEARPNAAELTPHDREAAVTTARKLGAVAGWSRAVAGPTLAALAAAVLLFLAFRVAGTRPTFRETFAVSAHGLLPVWLASLLSIPAVLARAPVRPEELATLLPSSPAALLPARAPAALAGALSGLDLFALWAVALVATGMARASGASRRRALAVTAVVYAAWIAVAKVALPALAAAGKGGP